MPMTSSRPYLVRALYDWINDNQCTPYLLVNALYPEVLVPQDHVNPDGQIILNISPTAVQNLVMGDASIHFSARFGGVPTEIFVPCRAVMGIYAKENQQGMIFEEEPEPEAPPPEPTKRSPPPDSNKSSRSSRPSLKIVK